MPGEQNSAAPDRRAPNGLHLFPCAVIVGAQAPRHDDRLQGAQSALNRIQVWLGDILIDLRRRRRIRLAAPDRSSPTLAADPGSMQ